MRPRAIIAAAFLAAGVTAAACGSAAPPEGAAEEATVTLMTHDSFNVSQPVLDAFRDETGITVKILTSGDAGAMLNQAILTKDAPVADVLFGVDNTFMTRALDAGIFEPYTPAAASDVAAGLRLDPRAGSRRSTTPTCASTATTPRWRRAGHHPHRTWPRSPARFKDDLVVENPATSSPGLAFLLATISEFGPEGWQQYWRDLRANGTKVVDGWETAYFTEFSAGGSGGSGLSW